MCHGDIPYKVICTTYTLRNSKISGDKGEAPEHMKRTRPPSFSLILLKTNLSHMGDGFLPETLNKVQMSAEQE